MNDVKRTILSRLAYYDVFGWPLTLMETASRCQLSGVLAQLDELVSQKIVFVEHGFYGLTAGQGSRRIAQEKIWAQKWRRMLRKAWWLQAVPYVRALCASGSLALGNMKEDSDWDVFVIAQRGRLYTARFGLLIVARFFGALRTKHDHVASDKFCFNHYVTTDGLVMRHRSIYTAHGLAGLVPFFDREHHLERLWQANQWIGDYLPMPTQAVFVRRSVRPSYILKAVAWIFEKILNTPLGWALETVLKKWQKRRIRRDPATYARGGRVITDDRELEFHPRSFEAIAVARYNATMTRYDNAHRPVHDSGLVR